MHNMVAWRGGCEGEVGVVVNSRRTRLSDWCQCVCQWGGTIHVQDAGLRYKSSGELLGYSHQGAPVLNSLMMVTPSEHACLAQAELGYAVRRFSALFEVQRR